MTLSRQLMLSGLFILLCLFIGMITFVVRNTQNFMTYQLASHSQDTATALGLTLTNTMKENDIVTASRTVDAVWDRGYYKSIIVEGSDGKAIAERQSQIKFYGVPEWFIHFLKLNTEPKEALIMEGWRKVGRVRVESNPGFAYQQVWLTFIQSFEWFLVTGVIAAILGGFLLYIILRPLRSITLQAQAICNQQFSIQKTLPWTIDLRLVVEAMNNMSSRLKRLFEEQTEVSKQLREQVFKDPLTQLGNRRYFDMQFDYILKDKEFGGALLLIELKDFKEYNDKYGYQEADILLQNISKTISEHCAYEDAVLARSQGATLFIILPNKPKEIAENAARSMVKDFNDYQSKTLSKEKDVASIGISLFQSSDTKSEILAHADMALRKAQTMGENQWYCMEQIQSSVIHGAREWEEIFQSVLRENKILLYFQETSVWVANHPKVYETLMRLKLSDSNIVPAGIFMPMAERLNKIQDLDKLVIQNVVNKIKDSNTKSLFSVNLSPSSLDDDAFKKWLLEKLKSLGKKANQFIIELPEYGVIHRIDIVRDFFLKFSALGGKTSIDHYGKNFSSFSYLYNLKLSFLKIDGSFIKKIEEIEENQFFVRSLIDIAHSLGISVIAEAVETKEEFMCLQQLKVDGVQGYFIGMPKELDF